MLRTALAVSLLSLMVILCFAPVTLGDYTEESTDLEGVWTSYYPDHFIAEGDNRGHWGALYDPPAYNFSAVHYRINLTDFYAILRSWSFSDFKKVNIRFDITAGGFWGDFNINMTAINQISWWGLTNDISVNMGGQYSIGQWRDLMDIYIIKTGNDTCTVHLSIWDLSGGSTQLENGTTVQGYNVYWEKDYTMSNPDFFNYPILGSLYVEHEGSGYFDFSVDTTWYTNGDLPDIIDGINVPEVVTGYTNWVQDILNFLSSGATFFMELLQILGGIAMAIAPYLGLILVFYLVDMAITSIRERSFQPIGQGVRWLYELLLQAWQTAIALGALIWDAITFWT